MVRPALALAAVNALPTVSGTEPARRFHFTPTYSSWLNQVEIWFAKIERDLIARGVFTSVPDLSRKLMKYIRLHAKSAKPFRWTCTNVSRRIVKR